MAVTITGVAPGSPADEAGLRPGMRLVALDGHPIRDGLDYEFYSAPARLHVETERDGAAFAVWVEKQEYQPLGCSFDSYLIDAQRHCRNKCVFCFVDQLPEGLRKPLYFKDDDERLGFLFGNYITLTNLGEEEIQRIIDMRISPVNISVHSANPDLRVDMMKNPGAGRVLEYIPRLAAAGIALNFQLVLCPGLNDGDELRRSIDWLLGFAPATQSIAAVPVGLTKHRAGLAPLAAYTKEQAARQLDILLEYSESRLVYPSDEWFLLAGREIPGEDFYGDYPQLENGVGMWRLFFEDFLEAVDAADYPETPPRADIATGMLAAPLLTELAEILEQTVSGARIAVHPVRNDFLGEGITVSGLVTGGDLISQLRGRLHSGRLLLSAGMLRAEGDITLDGMTPEEIGAALGVRVQVVQPDGHSLLAALLEPGA